MKKTTIGLLLTLVLIAIPALSSQQSSAEKITQGPVVEGVGDTWAVISWTTNTGGSTIVRYGTDANNLSQTAQAPYSDNESTASQNHRVHLKNLTPGTTYYYIVDSGQGEGTGTEAKSSVQQFTTKGAGQASSTGTSSSQAAAVKITDGPRVDNIGPTGATITWTTDTGGSSIVAYGTDRNNLNQSARAPYGTTHQVSIGGLKPNTTYYYTVDSGQGEGTGTEAKSSIQQFTTKPQ
jgi:phosphodiesterase/alkaline phosphatase D-like protein